MFSFPLAVGVLQSREADVGKSLTLGPYPG